MENWFSDALIHWYRKNKRELPWRQTKDPYKIWLSEVILQQTQVNQGLAYYIRFVQKFPDVTQLAAAKEDDVLKLWQGLGYYSRARNLHKAAKIVSAELKGQFPKKFEHIKALPGIGDYTAAAISSFSYNLPHAVVDGNVYRLLSRVFGLTTPIDSALGKKQFQALANSLLNLKNPSEYNQAIMEFGSQYCKPKLPACESCIFSTRCVAFNTGKIEQLPVKEKKTQIVSRYFNYFVLLGKGGKVVLQKRQGKDIWKGLYEFLLVESPKKVSLSSVLNSSNAISKHVMDAHLIHSSSLYKHQLSHQTIYAKFYVFEFKKQLPKNGLTIKLRNIDKYAFSRLTDKFLKDCDLKELF
jgi:A/G-specific adenine glycosylase